MRRLLHVVIVGSMVLGFTAALSSPSGAAAGDAIKNPGSVTFTVDAGGFLNLGGKALSLPSTATPKQCADGLNNDTAIDDATVPPAQQDGNIDFDGGTSAGVTPATAVDAQCNAGGGFTAATDDSEAKGGNQQRTYLTLTGTVDKDGNVTVPQASISFPKFYVFSKGANGVIDIIPAPTGDATGKIDPLTGDVSLSVGWQLEILQAFFKIDCLAPVTMNLSTNAADPANGGPLTVNPSGYAADGSFTITGNTFPVGGFAPNPSPPFTPATSAATCTSVGGSFGLPAAANASAAELKVHSSTVFESGVVPQIAGTVTAPDDSPVKGITVTLQNAGSPWVAVATKVTDDNGKYSFDNLAPGDYQVRFFDSKGTYQRTYSGGANTASTAPVITVGAGDKTVAVDQKLSPAPTGALTGRANLNAGGGVAGINVLVYSKTDGFYFSTTTGPSGYYLVKGVPAGDYYVWFKDPGGTYRSQWYKFKLLFFRADTVTVGTGTTWASALLG